MKFSILSLAALSFALSSAPAFADSVLFSDLGPASVDFESVYDPIDGWWFSGSGAAPESLVIANGFTAGGGGPQSVTQIDLAVDDGRTDLSPSTFYASIWTDVAGAPGSQVANAFWNNLLASPLESPCCVMVTVSGISGVTLIGGQQYFLVLGPVSLSDNTFNLFLWNSQGYYDSVLSSVDGGAFSGYTNPLGAFDILGNPVPEPTSIFLSATGFAALLAFRRRKAKL